MSLRRIIFWAHLAAGCTLGLFVFIMASTGVIMTYERQIVAGFEPESLALSKQRVAPLTLDQLSASAQRLTGQNEKTSLILRKDETTPVTVLSGRSVAGFLNPYTGDTLPNDSARPRAFFTWVRSFHRWLALEGSGKGTGKAITGAANIGFALMTLSGFYLWLPKVWRWQVFRVRAFFNTHPATAKARDHNWHHVFGIWALVPLLVISLSGMVFSYDWAGDLVSRAVGEASPAQSQIALPERFAPDPQNTFPLQEILNKARAYQANWTYLQVELPKNTPIMEVIVYGGTRGQPTKRTTLTYDTRTASIAKIETFNDIEPARRARIFLRYLHTGEVFGVVGQTLVGLASLAACFLIYTGLALAVRRLVLSR